ncbi:polyphosphate polymerase domain-containing protein [Clostridioides mangenotii]|uniref:polyphosphate polymerase domain-containing protein n=1 Tax=Metaclostridioides mangenotii TaxID=1540 RepID=UPI001C11A8E3|nr:polyphosphate polymerase domain-containing protein [Clostridioides mangenotii]MBU5307216.1 polyphosphate polymerase domain-containing protein [Clostridioides mangenotii]
MKSNFKYRFEIKHIVSEADVISIKSKLCRIMNNDQNSSKNGKYTIRSLYFDTPKNKAVAEKLDGVPYREKFRIRFYNYNSDFIKLEKKIKNNGMTLKFSASITKDDVEKILNNDIEFLKQREDSLLKEFYIKLKHTMLQPKSIVDYEREAYVYPLGNVRITLDSNIRKVVNSLDPFDYKSITTPIVENDMSVLEVKYDEFMPDFVRDLIQINKCSNTAMSKYVSSRLYI